MGERRLVALLKELLSLIGVLRFYEYCTATRFFPTDSPGLVVRVANPMAHAMGCRSFAALRLVDAHFVYHQTREKIIR